MAESTHKLRLIIEAAGNLDAQLRQMGDKIIQFDQNIRGSASGITQMGTAMSGVANQLGGTLTGAANAFRGSLDPLKISLDQIGSGVAMVQNKVASLTGVFGGLIAAVPVVMGLGVATEFLRKSLADASTETQNMMQLEAAWTAANRGSKQEMEGFADAVKTLSRTSSYASQDVIGAAKSLAGFGNIATDQLLPSLQVVIDVAANTGRTVSEAAYIVGYAARGNIYMLRQWGFSFTRATEQGKNYTDILRELGQQVSGQEAAKMQTYAGAVGMLEKAFNRTQKAIGHVIEAAITPVLQDLAGFFGELGKSVEAAFQAGATEEWSARLQEAFTRTSSFVKEMATGIVNFAQSGGLERIVNGFFNIAQAIQTVVGYVGSAIGWLIQLPSAALAAVAGLLGFKLAWSVLKSIWKMFQDIGGISDWVKGKIKTGVDAKVADIGREKTAVQGLTQAYRELDAQAAKKPTLKATGPASGMPSDWKEGYFDPRTGKPKGVEKLPDPVKPEKRLPPWMEGYYNVKTGEQIRPPAPQVPTTKAPAKTPWWKFGGTGKDVASGLAMAAGSVAMVGAAASETQGPLTMVSGILGTIAVAAGALPIPFAQVVSKVAAVGSLLLPWVERLLDVDQTTKDILDHMEIKPDDGLVEAFKERLENTQITDGKISEVERELRQQIEKSTDMTGAQKKKQIASLDKAFHEILKAASDHQKALAQVGREGAGKFADESEWDYKARLQRLKLYYNELEALQSSAHERERSRIWETASNEEDAQRRLKAFNITTILEKLAMKEQEFRAEAAMRKAEEEKEVEKVKHNADEVSKIRQDYALKDLEAQQKYQSEVQKSLQETEREIQKLYKERLDILSKQADAGRDAAKALDEIASKSRSEFENLSAKVRQASEETKRAIDLLPEQPEKALQVAQAARQAWVALAQDVKGLEKALKDQARWYDEFYRSLAKQKMGPEGQAQSDMQAAMKLKEEALQAYQQKDDKTAQEKIRQARDMMAEVAKSGPESMKSQALAMMGEIKAVDDMVAATMVDGAKALNEQAKGQIETLNKLIQDIWQAKMTENTAALNRLTEALNQQRGVAATPQTAPKEAGAGVSGIPTTKGTAATGGIAGLMGASGALGTIGSLAAQLARTVLDSPEARKLGISYSRVFEGPVGVQVGSVSPGFVETEDGRNFEAMSREERMRIIQDKRRKAAGAGAESADFVTPGDLRMSTDLNYAMESLVDGVVNAGKRIVGGVSESTKAVEKAQTPRAAYAGEDETGGVFGGAVDKFAAFIDKLAGVSGEIPGEIKISVTVNGGAATVSWG